MRIQARLKLSGIQDITVDHMFKFPDDVKLSVVDFGAHCIADIRHQHRLIALIGIMGCLNSGEAKAGVEAPGPITKPRSQGAAQCCAIPGRFCCTIFYAIAGGFGFR